MLPCTWHCLHRMGRMGHAKHRSTQHHLLLLLCEQAGAVNLVARARQFSSFLLLVGNISGPSSFTPKHAIILQNKDELLLQLLLEQLPTPQVRPRIRSAAVPP